MVEMARPRTALKYLPELPPVRLKARTIVIVETMPERMLTTIGVPKRAEKMPSTRGPAPSNAATAWLRSAPMIQVVPLEARAQMNPAAAMSPRALPAPVSVAVPSDATWPPYTVKTVLMASMKPPRLVIWLVGRTSRMARIGAP